MSKLKKKISVVGCMFSSFLMSGCSAVDTDSQLYDKIKRQTSELQQTSTEDMQQSAWLQLSQIAFSICDALKGAAPYVIIGSIVIGLLIRHFVSTDVAVRKKAMMIFIIGIPVIMILLTYGVAFLCGVFM